MTAVGSAAAATADRGDVNLPQGCVVDDVRQRHVGKGEERVDTLLLGGSQNLCGGQSQ